MLRLNVREMRAVRFVYAGAVAASVLAGYQLLQLRKRRLPADDYERRMRDLHVRSAERVYRGTVRLQGLMIKIGQTLGSRPDLLPEEFSRVLSRLQDKVPARPWKEMRAHIEEQLGAPIEHIFAEFKRQPVAAASLAQVYEARLSDGRRVAVKVIYPRIDRLVKTDLGILRTLIWLETRFLHYPLQPVYEELSGNIPHEVDMLHEAQSMEEIAALLSHREEVVIPRVVWEHTRPRVLVMEYVDGIKLTDLGRLASAGIDTRELFSLLAEVYFEQMLVHGHFHADPHPGNLLGLPGNRLAILDFGLTKRFAPDFHAAYRKMSRAVFTGDNDGFIEAMREAGFRLRDEQSSEALVAMAEFFRAMSDPDTYEDKEILDAANDAWIDALKRNPMMEMPGEIVLPMRVFGLLFGLGAVVGGGIDLPSDTIRNAAMKYLERDPEDAALLPAG